MEIKGIIKVANGQFSMSGNYGYGLIDLFGKQTLVKFSCPLESMPPRGEGSIVGQSFTLNVVDGQFYYNGEFVHTEIKDTV